MQCNIPVGPERFKELFLPPPPHHYHKLTHNAILRVHHMVIAMSHSIGSLCDFCYLGWG